MVLVTADEKKGSLSPATVDRRQRLAPAFPEKEMGEVLDPEAQLVPLNRADMRAGMLLLAISMLLEAMEKAGPHLSHKASGKVLSQLLSAVSQQSHALGLGSQRRLWDWVVGGRCLGTWVGGGSQEPHSSVRL